MEHSVLVLRFRNLTVSSASSPTLQATDCSCTSCSKLNCFFGLGSYVTGNRLFLYFVFEIKLFLRPQLLRYREQTIVCIMCSKFSCFLGLIFYVTGNNLLLVLRVRNPTFSSASLLIEPPAERGTHCTVIRCGSSGHIRDE
jgi:hypothetical protein